MKTLTELREQIRLWSEREDIADSQLNHFINLCEQEYKDDLYLPPNEKRATLVTDADGQIAIPSDYLKAKHMYVLDSAGNKKVLYRKPNEFVITGSSLESTGSTCYFERSGGYFIFAPAAGEGVEVYITYYSLIPSLIDIEESLPGEVNFVMAVMPTIYLFGSLMFLYMFTFNEERANYYAALYERAKEDLVGMQADAEMSGSSLHVVPTMSDSGSIW
jgi:hypothetical protein